MARHKKPKSEKISGSAWFDSFIAQGANFDNFIIFSPITAASNSRTAVNNDQRRVHQSVVSTAGVPSSNSRTCSQRAFVNCSASKAEIVTTALVIGAGRKSKKVLKLAKTIKEKDAEILSVVLKEVLGIVPEKKQAPVIAKKIAETVNQQEVFDGPVLNQAYLKELARLQAWLIVEELKRKAERDDEEALLLLL